MKLTKHLIFFACSGLLSTTIFANQPEAPNEKQNKVTSVINKVIQAYGGSHLLDASSIEIHDYQKTIFVGESERPEQPEIWQINEKLIIDFKQQRKNLHSWRVSRTGKDLEEMIYDGNEGRVYDILHGKYSVESWVNYKDLGDAIEIKSTPMIARYLHQNQKTIQYEGQETYRGLLHDKISYSDAWDITYTLFIDPKGLISKRVRNHHAVGEIAYLYENPVTQGNITYAADMNFFVGGKWRASSVKRKVILNPDITNAFQRKTGFEFWGETIKTPEISISKIGKNAYHVGKDRAYSLFLDTGQSYIAAGGGSKLAENLQALNAYLNQSKKISHYVVSHHHRDNLRQVKAAHNLGAKIVTTRAHLANVKKQLPNTIPDNHFILVDKQLRLAEGNLQVFDIATAHSQHYLTVYLKESGSIFADDHFETQLLDGPIRPFKDMVNFIKKIKSLPIQVNTFYDAHSQRQLSMKALTQATEQFTPVSCPTGYAVCQNS